jgi:hypothetical protein
MIKAFSQLFCLLLLCLAAVCQGKTERIVINWPGEYNWKTVRQAHDENTQISMIIPGNDSIANPSVIGSLTVYRGTRYSNLERIVDNYKSRIDTGTTLTPIQKEQNAKYPWVIFKVETPATNKYPEPESDLYYVVQGKFGLYENYVGIKAARLSEDFVKKWTAIFMTSKITTD